MLISLSYGVKRDARRARDARALESARNACALRTKDWLRSVFESLDFESVDSESAEDCLRQSV